MHAKTSHLLRLGLPPVLALAGLGGAVAFALGRRAEPAPCCHHQPAPPTGPGWSRSEAAVELPDVRLVRADGAEVALRREIDDGRPVVLNFVFTTCTAICPVLSQTFARAQAALGPDRDRVHLVSVSIDPEHDTPARLVEYAKRFGAGPGWDFYTGTPEASVAVQKAFGIHRGDKMNHAPVTFLRAAPGEPWVRIDGFARAEEVVAEHRRLAAAGGR